MRALFVDHIRKELEIIMERRSLYGGQLTIGVNSGISNVVIHCHNKIEIGDYVNIGDGVMIFDTNFHSTSWTDRADRGVDIKKAISKPIYIKDYAFRLSLICLCNDTLT